MKRNGSKLPVGAVEVAKIPSIESHEFASLLLTYFLASIDTFSKKKFNSQKKL